MNVMLAMDYNDDDIAHLKEQRRYFATREQGAEKTERKFCQRRIKAINIALRHMEGTGPSDIPLELEFDVMTAFAFATNVPRTHYKDLVPQSAA